MEEKLQCTLLHLSAPLLIFVRSTSSFSNSKRQNRSTGLAEMENKASLPLKNKPHWWVALDVCKWFCWHTSEDIQGICQPRKTGIGSQHMLLPSLPWLNCPQPAFTSILPVPMWARSQSFASVTPICMRTAWHLCCHKRVDSNRLGDLQIYKIGPFIFHFMCFLRISGWGSYFFRTQHFSNKFLKLSITLGSIEREKMKKLHFWKENRMVQEGWVKGHTKRWCGRLRAEALNTSVWSGTCMLEITEFKYDLLMFAWWRNGPGVGNKRQGNFYDFGGIACQ